MCKESAKNPSELQSTQVLEMALEALEDVPLELEWTMPELFRGYVWKQLQPSARRTVGSLFKEAMKKRDDIRTLSEKNHVQLYKKIDPSSNTILTPKTKKKHRN